MIKIKNQSFEEWCSFINDKEVIISNEGIGDTIICSNFAKYFDKAVLRISDNENNNLFCKEFCELTNVPYFYLNKKNHNHLNDKTIKIIKQFDLQKYFNVSDNTEILKKIYTKNSELFKMNQVINNDVFICPNASIVNQNVMVRSIEHDDLKNLIKKIKSENFNVWLVGIDKDIEKYGFYENCKWINSHQIIDSEIAQQINLNVFLQKVASCYAAITVATSFEHICGMLSVKTFTLHRLDNYGKPIINNYDDYHNFFSNNKWYETIKKISRKELLELKI